MATRNKRNFNVDGANNCKTEKCAKQQTLEILQVVGEVILLFVKLFLINLESLYRLIVPIPEKPVKGEIVVITGTGHGIGKQLALRYASEGATVVGLDVNEQNNKNTIQEINKLGHKAYSYICDITKREEVIETANKVLKEIGDIGILINNAGIMPCQKFMETTPQQIEKIFQVNILAHFWIVQAFLPTMLKNNHGHIVSISSCAGLYGLKNLAAYCSSKFAVRGMIEGLFQELRDDPKCRLKATLIYPYMVDTGLCKKPVVRFKDTMPMLKPEDVAREIMDAQRRETAEICIPRYLLPLFRFTRIMPMKAAICINDFFNTYVEAD